jgi:hypothetical protein
MAAATVVAMTVASAAQARDETSRSAMHGKPAVSAECKQAMQFAWFKHQLALTDGGPTDAASTDVAPRECDAQAMADAADAAQKTQPASAKESVAVRTTN